jgi:hypothetical protein
MEQPTNTANIRKVSPYVLVALVHLSLLRSLAKFHIGYQNSSARRVGGIESFDLPASDLMNMEVNDGNSLVWQSEDAGRPKR